MIDSKKIAEILTKRQSLTMEIANTKTMDAILLIARHANKVLGIKSIKPKELGDNCISVIINFEDDTTLEGIVKKQDGQYIPIS